jgi:hypothetical protein
MAIINYTDQLKYAGKGYLDAKMTPVNTYEELKLIPVTQRFEGLTVVVLNNGNPQDYWLVGGISNSCWIPKTNTNFNELRLVLENGFLKLTYANNELGEPIDLNNFFPDNGILDEPYIKSVDYATNDLEGNAGIFLCFLYSDNTTKYLDMSQFLSRTYNAGNGIVINGDIISIDSALIGKIESIEQATIRLNESIQTNTASINNIEVTLANTTLALTAAVNDIESRVGNERIYNEDGELVAEATGLTKQFAILKERVNALSSASEGSTPDCKTIGITDDEQKALYVKILEKDGNLLGVDSENGETGLYAFIPVFCDDDELK